MILQALGLVCFIFQSGCVEQGAPVWVLSLLYIFKQICHTYDPSILAPFRHRFIGQCHLVPLRGLAPGAMGARRGGLQGRHGASVPAEELSV